MSMHQGDINIDKGVRSNIVTHEKLKIVKLDNTLTTTSESFTVMFNPTQYVETFGVKITSETMLSGMGDLKFQQLQNQTLILDLMFDSSYVNEYAWKKIIIKQSFDTLDAQITKLRKITGYTTDSSMIKPNKIQLVWGKLKYICLLEKMELKYTRFDRAGYPIRATGNATFRSIPVPSSSTEDSEKDITIKFG